MSDDSRERILTPTAPQLRFDIIIAWIALAAAMGLLFILAATGEIRLG